jgi:hypothetical protein
MDSLFNFFGCLFMQNKCQKPFPLHLLTKLSLRFGMPDKSALNTELEQQLNHDFQRIKKKGSKDHAL